jgi:TetR/AcrR family transcriptional regulator
MTTAPIPLLINTRRSSELRQQEIIEIVLVLAAERGVEAITTTSIAERLGLTQGAVFRHFPNKEAIWTAVLFWLTGNMAEIFERRPGIPPLREIERIFDGYMDFITAYPAMPRLIFSDTFHHAYPDLHRSVRDLVAGCEMRFQDLIGEAAALGDIKPGRAEAAAKLLLTTIQGIAFQSAILGLVTDPPREGKQLFTLWKSTLHADIQTMPATPDDDCACNPPPGRLTGAELTRMRLENCQNS